MAPTAFQILTVNDEFALLSAIRSIPDKHDQPIFIGRCYYWTHAPSLSLPALTGSGPKMHVWTHLLVHRASTPSDLSLPKGLDAVVSSKWTMVADVADEQLSTFASAQALRKSRSAPPLPAGWSPSDHSALDAAAIPADLDLTLANSVTPFGEEKTNPQGLKDFVRSFGQTHIGPVVMLNLLAYLFARRAGYFEYIAEFGPSFGATYGPEAMLFGAEATEWSSRTDERAEIADPAKGGSEVWEDVALVWYPSIWHFAKMLDNPEYARLDRAYKKGVIKDNPILCCTELSWKQE